MLFKVYVFGLVLGGVLLAASMFGGDGAHDADGADVGDDALTHGDVAGLAALLLSLRFWSFFAAFFGLTGVLLYLLELTGARLGLGLSIGMGALSGTSAVLAFRALAGSEVGEVPTAAEYVGQTGRVLLPVSATAVGKVRLELRGTTVDVLAVSDDPVPLAVGETALVVEMQDTTASVTRMLGQDKAQ